MEAARQRVAVLERELEHLSPGGSTVPIEVELVELRRRLVRAEEALGIERRERERGERAVQELAVANDRVRALDQSLEMVQAELQRRRREHESLWRQAALASVRSREADELRTALDDSLARAEREARRADVAVVALIRTQMKLSVERARPLVDDPWPLDAAREQPAALEALFAPSALEARPEDDAEHELTRLAFLFADLIWNSPSPTHQELRELLALLRRVGHPLIELDAIRLGPPLVDGPGLRIAMAPLALQVAWTGSDGRELIVTISDDDPLSRSRAH